MQFFVSSFKQVTLPDGRLSFPEPTRREISQDEAVELSELTFAELEEHLKSFTKASPKKDYYEFSKKEADLIGRLEVLSMPVISEVSEKWRKLSESLKDKIKIVEKEKLHNQEAYRISSNLGAIRRAADCIMGVTKELLKMKCRPLVEIFDFIKAKEAVFSGFNLDVVDSQIVASDLYQHLVNPEVLAKAPLREIFNGDNQGRFDRLVNQIDFLEKKRR